MYTTILLVCDFHLYENLPMFLFRSHTNINSYSVVALKSAMEDI